MVLVFGNIFSMNTLLRRPSAWIPIVLTFGILAVLGLYFLGVIPPDPTGDEGTGAHLFQLWLLAEPFAIVFFAFKCFKLKPRETLIALGLQIALALVPIVIVFSLNL